MVVKMMKWMSCSPLLSSKKYEAKITVNCLKGFNFLLNEKMGVQDFDRLRVEIKWKGSSKGISLNLGSFNRRSVKKNFTKEECLKKDKGIVEWNEEFLSVCNFSGWKDGVFQPWEVVFTVINVSFLIFYFISRYSIAPVVFCPSISFTIQYFLYLNYLIVLL